MSTNRRTLLKQGFALTASTTMLSQLSVAGELPAKAALEKSSLIYLSPILSNGTESKCHGEVWFVYYKDEVIVVTQSDAWRAQAVRRNLTTTAIWIGEFGVWSRAKNRFKSAPYLRATGQLENDRAFHASVLAKYAEKYVDEWGSWGPRFEKGLAEGTRVMLRYRPS